MKVNTDAKNVKGNGSKKKILIKLKSGVRAQKVMCEDTQVQLIKEMEESTNKIATLLRVKLH